MNIVVLAGGLSTERDVSVVSGMMVTRALRRSGHRVVLLDVFMGYEQDECDIEALFEQGYDFTQSFGVGESIPELDKIKALRRDHSDRFLGENVEQICRYADICFLALHGGDGENGKIQATFDLLGIKYTGTGYLGSAVAMNKGITKSIFLNHNVNTPAGECFVAEDMQTGKIDEWKSFPCVVKPCSGGSSVGVSIAEDKDNFLKARKEAFKYEAEVLVEHYVKGREFSVGVIDGKALPIIEIIPKCGFYDYVNKYQEGRTQEVCPAQLDEKTTALIQREAEKAYKVLHLEAYARIDFLLDADGNTYALEANTLPGMTSASLIPQEAYAAGLSYEELCNKIIEVSLKKYNKI